MLSKQERELNRFSAIEGLCRATETLNSDGSYATSYQVTQDSVVKHIYLIDSYPRKKGFFLTRESYVYEFSPEVLAGLEEQEVSNEELLEFGIDVQGMSPEIRFTTSIEIPHVRRKSRSENAKPVFFFAESSTEGEHPRSLEKHYYSVPLTQSETDGRFEYEYGVLEKCVQKMTSTLCNELHELLPKVLFSTDGGLLLSEESYDGQAYQYELAGLQILSAVRKILKSLYNADETQKEKVKLLFFGSDLEEIADLCQITTLFFHISSEHSLEALSCVTVASMSEVFAWLDENYPELVGEYSDEHFTELLGDTVNMLTLLSAITHFPPEGTDLAHVFYQFFEDHDHRDVGLIQSVARDTRLLAKFVGKPYVLSTARVKTYAPSVSDYSRIERKPSKSDDPLHPAAILLMLEFLQLFSS